MEKRRLGATGLAIAPLVLGGNVFGCTIDERASFAVLDAFVDHGFNAVDTADVSARSFSKSPRQMRPPGAMPLPSRLAWHVQDYAAGDVSTSYTNGR